MPIRPLIAAAAAALLVLTFGPDAQAHDSRPLSVEVTEQGQDLYLARLRVPPSVASDNQPQIAWPAGCRTLQQHAGEDGVAPSQTALVVCKGGLPGQALAVRYPIYNPALSTLFRLIPRDGEVFTKVLPPDRPVWQVPRKPSLLEVAASYLRLGVEHIWTGVDHLLFVTGLLILAGSPRRVLLAVTGFTIAHSITLSLSALDVVRLPGPPVEAAIALSILFLAREIARPSPDGLAARYPVLVSSSFGLLHGFGFAAALREAGLPKGELAAGLLCFNLGVEIGQVVFIAGVTGVFLVGRWAASAGGLRLAPFEGRLTRLAGYGLGIPAAVWFVQRLALLAP